ncbi:hypothetical protein HNR46_001588 [Haloferula luteola]|uniref:Mu-like prophage I protein n=1 Tax=Haloferula luteola TaxID=595692 RepID=A0A840V009_9BACT|nr:phage protease [Haloferula luteola]MBB5351352.1 hypothetical protein [Haloferula luteola]
MITHVTAFAMALPDGNSAPAEIVYFPEGTHTITPLVNGKAGRLTVKVSPDRGPSIAAKLQQDLAERQRENVRPIFDFEHKNGAASAIPTGFRYEVGRGVIAAVDWTDSGRRAVEGRDFSYFSPEFLLNQETGEPTGLPKRGPLGGLVNDPAFREIPRIAAANAEHHFKSNQPDPMATALILATCGLLSEKEAALETAETLARTRISAMRSDSEKLKDVEAKLAASDKENADLKKRLSDMEEADKKAKAKRAETAVEDAVKAGRIAPKDEATKSFWRNTIENGGETAVAALNAIPATHGADDIETPALKIAAGDGRSSVSEFEKRAEALISAKQATSLDEAYAQVAASNPRLYEDYCKQFDTQN